MGSKADFYVGRGVEAEWIGSIGWDGLPAALPTPLLSAQTEDTFRVEVASMLAGRSDSIPPANGWPWEWDTSHGTTYTYAFDQNRVWVSCYGSSWWKATVPEPDHTTLARKAAKFPDMSIYRKGESLFEREDKPKRRAKKASNGVPTHS